MNHDDENDQKPPSDERGEVQLGFDSDSFNENPRRLEPVFDDFEEREELEASPEEEGEEADFAVDSYGNELEKPPQESNYNPKYDDDTIDYEFEPECEFDEGEDEDEGSTYTPEPAPLWQSEDLKPELIREELEEAVGPEPELPMEEEDWADEPSYASEPDVTEGNGAWPMGLIIVAAFALLLLAAGGYGVMQQRSATAEEIRALQAALATSTNPEEVAASREAQRRLEQENLELQATITALHEKLGSLQDTVAGLEQQLVTTVVPATTPKPQPKPTIATAKKAAANINTGNWFVNFGSYQKRETANSWISRLKPDTGKVVVIPSQKDGDTFYRVRVIEISSKKQAEGIARSLEQEYDLSKLWIGEQ